MLNKYRTVLDAVRSIHTVNGSDESIMTVLEILEPNTAVTISA
jgi:hypothetical protein